MRAHDQHCPARQGGTCLGPPTCDALERDVDASTSELQERVRDAVALAEGALHGTEGRRAIWTDADYLCAILATLTGDGMRARAALLTQSLVVGFERPRRRSLPPEAWPGLIVLFILALLIVAVWRG